MIKNGKTYRLITDQLGSIRFVVDVATGAVAQKLDYDEFGNVTQNTNPDFQPFAYAGGLYDSRTKLVRFGARDYEAKVGRWMCKDPIGFNAGINFYIYVECNPTNNTDPLGLYDCTYSISKHKMVCAPNTIPHAPFISVNFVSGTNEGLLGPLNHAQNNPDYTGVQDHGPIPVGDYIISRKPGSLRQNLIPYILNKMFGRKDFQIHGCSDPKKCSKGCIAATNNATRDRLNELMDLEEENNVLHVVP